MKSGQRDVWRLARRESIGSLAPLGPGCSSNARPRLAARSRSARLPGAVPDDRQAVRDGVLLTAAVAEPIVPVDVRRSTGDVAVLVAPAADPLHAERAVLDVPGT